MKLVFDILSPHTLQNDLRPGVFTQKGGVLGRGQECDWVIPDPKRHLSTRHADISFLNGQFFLTDISTNGIREGANGTRLPKGVPVRIEHGNLYELGEFKIHARITGAPQAPYLDNVGLAGSGYELSDDALQQSDPLRMLDERERDYAAIDQLISGQRPQASITQRSDNARLDTESLIVPQLIDAPVDVGPVQKAVVPQSEAFWEQFSAAAGVSLKDLDQEAKETLVLNTARLLKQCVNGLQQSYRIQSDLKNELRLAQTIAPGSQKNPLKYSDDPDEALCSLLQPDKPGQLSSEQILIRAFHDVQAHEVALVVASRAAARSALDHFSPQTLTLRLERDNARLFTTSGSRWKAYTRYHSALRQDDEWIDRLMARDFARAYEEQLRLINTLHPLQG